MVLPVLLAELFKILEFSLRAWALNSAGSHWYAGAWARKNARIPQQKQLLFPTGSAPDLDLTIITPNSQMRKRSLRELITCLKS